MHQVVWVRISCAFRDAFFAVAARSILMPRCAALFVIRAPSQNWSHAIKKLLQREKDACSMPKTEACRHHWTSFAFCVVHRSIERCLECSSFLPSTRISLFVNSCCRLPSHLPPLHSSLLMFTHLYLSCFSSFPLMFDFPRSQCLGHHAFPTEGKEALHITPARLVSCSSESIATISACFPSITCLSVKNETQERKEEFGPSPQTPAISCAS